MRVTWALRRASRAPRRPGTVPRLHACAALVLLLVLAVPARAQGYTVTPAVGRIEARPVDAARVDVTSAHAGKSSAVVPLPFEFWSYGTPCRTAAISAHGWIVPGAREGFADAADPSAAHGQDAASGAFPYGPGGASADGVVAPLWTSFTAVNDGSESAGQVLTWTSGTAPQRRFVVSWERVVAGTLGRVTVQAQLHEATWTIVFAYAADAVTGATAPPTQWVCGLDESAGARFTAPLATTARNAGVPPSDFVLTPRTVLFNSPDAPERGVPVTWRDIPRESLRGADGARSAPYVASGTCWFFVPDRVTRSKPARAKELAAEDRATFPGAGTDAAGAAPRGAGDTQRWVRQVLDGKLILLPDDDGPPVRVWFRVIEWFTIDDRGLAGRDDHVWNVRILLSMVFPASDPRSRIENWCAWRGMASARLAVVKLFAATQRDDAGRQFDTGRVGEDVNWCARLKAGFRGPMPANDCPTDGWVDFRMKDKDEVIVQHAEKRDVRDVADPNYVESGYSYVIRSEDGASGWVSRRRTPPATMTDEGFDVDR